MVRRHDLGGQGPSNGEALLIIGDFNEHPVFPLLRTTKNVISPMPCINWLLFKDYR